MGKFTRITLVLLVLLPEVVLAQDFSYSEAGRTFTIDYLAPPPNGASADNPPRWRYFLETGDGHYYMDTLSVVPNKATKIKHSYAAAGTYTASLFLSPMYALANTKEKVARQVVVSTGRADNPPKYDLGSAVIDMVSNASGEAIANHQMRFALHHQRYGGAADRGYLVFFYNHIDDSDFLGFDPFVDEEDPGLYYKRQGVEQLSFVDRPLIDVETAINSTGRFLFKKVSTDYNDAIVFRSESLGSNETRQAFLSLLVDKKIDYKRQKNYKLQLAALWIPDSGVVTEGRNMAEYELKVERIHDPNKIEVSPEVAYYRKNYPKELTYKIIFKNTGRGQVRHSRIGVSLSPDLLTDSLELLPELVKPFARECPEGFDEFNDRCVEIEKLSYPLQDSVYFSYYNIGLNKKEEGEIAFRIITREGRPQNSRVDGQVVFRGGKPDPLRAARVQWRHKSLHLQLGYLLNPKLEEFNRVEAEDFVDRFPDDFSIGLEFQNSPLGTGRTWGYGVKFNTYQFDRQVLAFDNTYFQVDTFKLRNIDVYAIAGYQFRNNIRVKGTAGVALPVLADLDVAGFFDRTRDRGTGQFGLLQPLSAPAYFNQTLKIQRAAPGFTGGVGVEVGDVHSIVAGIRQEWRIYPSFYHGKCAKFNNLEVYFRFKLSAIGGRWQ